MVKTLMAAGSPVPYGILVTEKEFDALAEEVTAIRLTYHDADVPPPSEVAWFIVYGVLVKPASNPLAAIHA